MSSVSSSRGIAALVIGDIIAYLASLVFTLAIRYGAIPGKHLLATHLIPFGILFVVFLLVSLSAGLYDKQAALIRGRVQGLLIKVQIANAMIGVLFFYIMPVAIAPKANLAIYFVISTILLYVWRMIMFPVINSSRKQAAILIGSGDDVQDLHDEINGNARYSLIFKEQIVPKPSVAETVATVSDAVKRANASIVIADLHDQKIESAMPFLYSLIFSGVQIIDASKFYEAIFDRIPISLVGERWLVENSASALGNRRVFDVLKRAMDIVIAGIIGLISLIVYPFVYVAIKLDDHGPIFVTQDRTGKNGKIVTFYKFRSMSGNDQGKYGNDGASKFNVTRVGKFIRNTRIDELPQLWNVVKGDLSLIGPRPEFPSLIHVYKKEIPYYNARHLVKPGLSGWAQIYHENHPHHEVDTEEARNKLSYDLYYIKNRSLTLDLKIAFRTIQILMKRVGK